jgi:hypothetical protein
LSDDCLNHVLSEETTSENGWLTYDKLADVIDNYYANRVKGKPFAAAIGFNGKSRQREHNGDEIRC